MDETRRRRFARAAAVPLGLIASGALVFAGSQSAFTATTDNPGNSWEAGQVSLKNDGSNGTFATTSTPAVFTVDPIAPGDSASRCVVVRNESSIDGDAAWYLSDLIGENTTSVTEMRDALQLDVVFRDGAGENDCSDFSSLGAATTAYSGAFAGAPTTFGGASQSTWDSALDERTYRITWSLPSTVGNSVQGTTAGATLNWEIRAGA
jgi:hypothetical protein